MEKTEHLIELLHVEPKDADAKLIQLMLDGYKTSIGRVSRIRRIEDLETLSAEDIPDVILFGSSLYLPEAITRASQFLRKHPEVAAIALLDMDDEEWTLQLIKSGFTEIVVKDQLKAFPLFSTIQKSIARVLPLVQKRKLQNISKIGFWSYRKKEDTVHSIDLGFLMEKESGHTFDLNQLPPWFQEFIQEADHQETYQKEIMLPIVEGQGGRSYYYLMSQKQSGRLQGTIQDISDRKQAEEILGESRQQYMDIFANASDAIYLSNLNGQLTECNQAGLSIFGITKDDFAWFNVHEHFVTEESIHPVITSITERYPIKDAEIEIIQKGGNKRQCLISVVYFSEETDNYTGIIRDITERKVADELRKERVLEQKSIQLKEQFVASISHEMRTPMNAIVGLSNLLLDTPLSEEQRNYFKSIQHSSELLLGILNDILDISSLKNGKVIFENKDFDLYDLLNNLIHNLAFRLTEKDVRLELSIDPDVPRFLKGDKLRLNQVLYNLAGNAVKFTDTGHVKVSSTLLGQSGDTVLVKFSVEDTGIGIPKDKQEAIFDSFTRITHKERIIEGTGLGLAISKSLIEQQGGKIWVSSEPDKGSTFFFDMVLEVGAKPQNTLGGPGKLFTKIVNPKTILIVEDNQLNQLVAKKILAKRWPEAELLLAENGQIAMNLLSEKIDIILMDLHMPVMDGYETTLTIREMDNPKLAKIPILAMTADAQIQEDNKHERHQFDDFVIKPFEPETLFEKILLQLNEVVKA